MFFELDVRVEMRKVGYHRASSSKIYRYIDVDEKVKWG
jgi:hypothetical protein